MAKITLPETLSEVESYNPRLMIWYGQPKTGKSSAVAALNNIGKTLVLDLENGYSGLSVYKLKLTKASEIFAVRDAIIEKTKKDGKPPYRFIALDNVTRLEEFSVPYANKLYRQTPMGKDWGYLKDELGRIRVEDGKRLVDPEADVRNLPQGGGWGYMRTAMQNLIEALMGISETLILVGHVKDKQINLNGEEISQLSLDLTGKTGSIVSGIADAIGLIYRKGNETHISFIGGDGTIKAARNKHLAEKDFVIATSSKDEKGELKIDYDLSALFV